MMLSEAGSQYLGPHCWEEEEISLKQLKNILWTFNSDIFHFLKFSYYQATQTQSHDIKQSIWLSLKFNTHIQGLMSWEYNTSTENTYKTQKQADPSSYKDRWPANYIISCEILLQCLRKLWFQSMSQVSFSTSFLLLSSPLVGLFQRLTNQWAHQMFSCPPKKYLYDVKRDIFLLFHSSIICTIYRVWVPTEYVSLLTSSS